MDGQYLIFPDWVDLLYPIAAMNVVLIVLAVFLVARDRQMSAPEKVGWTILTVVLPIVGAVFMIYRQMREGQDD
ncbi:PLDc N-terminal domain-containing protein [Gordonia sp. (in: high G+C Gram-positive bacteria)]|uniref:PLDc N-terminal domain-containing protein n=1 Tax=Gordonia sp. (in: high G+C Gram-positive bacteria) TaxID=84139 RepID=UPI003C76FF7A